MIPAHYYYQKRQPALGGGISCGASVMDDDTLYKYTFSLASDDEASEATVVDEVDKKEEDSSVAALPCSATVQDESLYLPSAVGGAEAEAGEKDTGLPLGNTSRVGNVAGSSLVGMMILESSLLYKDNHDDDVSTVSGHPTEKDYYKYTSRDLARARKSVDVDECVAEEEEQEEVTPVKNSRTVVEKPVLKSVLPRSSVSSSGEEPTVVDDSSADFTAQSSSRPLVVVSSSDTNATVTTKQNNKLSKKKKMGNSLRSLFVVDANRSKQEGSRRGFLNKLFSRSSSSKTKKQQTIQEQDYYRKQNHFVIDC
ncbi:expressed unknown protein [Seminavis robusta]|uniref:Uncharacterized protein n=1 Tax=Seminavis robusta TaxID=568900 RepID=A0A9N8HXY1_9STRA|nr:expressed unknown protein [Seminavis robusta]|eukprot:Sro1894_g303930.1 n/a (310) ;mRNA; r:6679-7608